MARRVVMLEGRLADWDLGMVLGILAQRQWTGTVTTIAWDCSTGSPLRFWLTQGRLTYGAPIDPALEHDRSLDYGLAPETHAGLPGGYGGLWRAMDQGAIAFADLRPLWRSMILELLFEGFGIRSGRFVAVPGAPLSPNLGGWPMAPLRSQIRRTRQAWHHLAPLITSLDQCPRVTDIEAAHAALAPTPYAAIATWADGRTSLRQLNRRLGGNTPVAIGRCLHQGHQAGWLHLPPAPEPGPSDPPSILYVGDDPDLSQPIALDLRAHGYDICVEANPFTALNYICDTLPDLILCDRHLPSLPGPTFAALVRQLPQGDRIPFILIQSPQTSPPEILDSSLITLTKPCTTRMLLTLIPQHLPPKKRLRK